MVTTKKTAAKKVTPAKKAGVPKQNHKKSKRVLVHAEGPQCFWATNGLIIANLLELRDALEEMDREVFGYHATEKKNDFADWIEYVLGDTELAAKLRGITTPKKARTVVVSRLKIYDI